MPGGLDIGDVTKSFGDNAVLRGLSLTVAPGTTTAVVGPSGSGKTTLLRVVAGFEQADAGEVRLGERVLSGSGTWVPAHHRRIGYVAQDGALFPHLTVGQNVAFGMDPGELPDGRRGIRRRVGELLELVSLDPALARRRPHEVSGGQQQRVALARALARRPTLMLLDESFSSLDAGLRSTTRRTVASVLNGAGITTVLVTHDQAEALSFADEVAVIRDGVLAQVGPPREVYGRPRDRATAEFLGEAVVLEAVVEGRMASCVLGQVAVVDPPVEGRAQLLLRPEQIRVDPGSAIRGVVVDREFYGAESTVRLRLESVPSGPGQVITIRHWNSAVTEVGANVGLVVQGEGTVFPAVE